MDEDQEATLGIGAVSRRTGLTPDLLRVWERRHRAVTPERTDGGTRLYRERDVRRLEMLARLVGRGHRIGSLAALSDDALLELLGRSPAAPRSAAAADLAEVGFEAWLENALESILAVDSAALEDQLTRLFLVLGPRAFTLEVALPLLVRVGDLWAAGELSIAAEHATVEVLRTLLGGTLRRRAHRPDAQRVVFATPTGHRHEFGALAAALLASEHGVDAIFVGADLPIDEIAFAAARTGAEAVVLGLSACLAEAWTEAGEGSEARSGLEALREALPREVMLCIGGLPEATDREDVGALLKRLDVMVFSSLSDFDERVARHGRIPSARDSVAEAGAGDRVTR